MSSLLLSAQDLPQSKFASIHGTVRDPQGRTVADAVVQLQGRHSRQIVTTHTNSQGMYAFSAVNAGEYVLRLAARGYEDSEVPWFVLASREAKTVDLTLGTPQASESTTASAAAPQFFDEPQFTVSGVTDTTSLGGHGSDTAVRTRESIAKETVALARPAADNSIANEGNGDLEHARDQIRTLLGQHETAELHHRMGDIQERLGDPLAAVREYQRAAEMDPSEPFLFDWGSELLLHHAPEPALQVFTKGNSTYPRSSRMLIGLGAAWFAQGSADQAARHICDASDLNPNDPIPYRFLGKMQRTESKPSEEVVQKLHRFVSLQPENPEANYYYAVALWKLRKPAHDPDLTRRVESLLKTAIHFNPKFADADLQLGIIHSEGGDYAAAISAYQQAIQDDPQMEEAHYRLAQVYRQQGQAEKGKEELKTYEHLATQSAQRIERERHDIRQFVYTLRDQPGTKAR
jgi:tetratricopeptide (TPR) repeat protein